MLKNLSSAPLKGLGAAGKAAGQFAWGEVKGFGNLVKMGVSGDIEKYQKLAFGLEKVHGANLPHMAAAFDFGQRSGIAAAFTGKVLGETYQYVKYSVKALITIYKDPHGSIFQGAAGVKYKTWTMGYALDTVNDTLKAVEGGMSPGVDNPYVKGFAI